MNKGKTGLSLLKVTVKPEVKLGEYKNLTVSKQDREVTDEDVGSTFETRTRISS